MATDESSTDGNDGNMVLTGVRLPPRVDEVVEKLAEKQDRSKSAVVRSMVMDDLRERTFMSEIDKEVKQDLRADGWGPEAE